MTTVHAVAAHPPKGAGATKSAEAADTAAGDLFATLVAALLPQIHDVVDGTATGETGDGTGGDATSVVTGAEAATATDGAAVTVHLDLTELAGAPAADAGKVDGLQTAIAAHKPDSPAMPILEGLAVRRSAGDGTAVKAAAGQGDDKAATPAAPSIAPVASGTVTDAKVAAAEESTDEADAVTTAGVDEIAPHAFPVAHDAHVEAGDAVSDAKPVVAATPQQQLASVIAPLRQRPDGTYHLALRLHPEHLGAVDVDVQLHQGTVEVHVQTQHAEARDILLAHIDELRSELEQAGLRAGTLDVSDRGQPRHHLPQQGRASRSPVSPDPSLDGPATPSVTQRPARQAASAGAVDVDM